MKFMGNTEPSLCHRRILTKTMLIMKITVVLLLAFGLQVSARGYAQSVTISVKNTPIKKVFAEISRQTGFSIIYDAKLFKGFPNISLSIGPVSMNDALRLCLNTKLYTYEIGSNTVFIKKTDPGAAEPRTPAPTPLPPPMEVTGKIVSEEGVPLSNVNITIKGMSGGVTTDQNGEFKIQVANENAVLVISYVGYASQQLRVGNRTNISVKLSVENAEMAGVVVTGYSSQRKKDIAGSVSVVDVTTAKRVVATSTEQILQGQAAGVTVINTGAPGSGSNVFIRGINNFGNTTPLYVIDGVQVGGMGDINPTDIESIQVLKDAGSAAIYGVSGGNGVIIVTTKKGKSGKTVFNYDGFYGSQNPKGGNVLHLLDSKGMLDLVSQLDPTRAAKLYPNGKIPKYGYHGPTTSGVTDDDAILSSYNFDAANPANDFLVMKFNQTGTDWFHEVFKPAAIQSHTITASGGSSKNSYLLSLNYLDQQGTMIYTYLKRYAVRINTIFNINDHFRMGEHAYITYRQTPFYGGAFSNQNESNLISNLFISPTIPVHDAGGNFAGTYDVPGGEPLGTSFNPVAMQTRTRNNYFRSWNLLGDAFMEVDLAKFLTVRSTFGGSVNYNYQTQISYNPYDAYEQHSNPNGTAEQSNYYSGFNWTNQVNYHQVFGKSSLTVVAGSEIKSGYGRGMGGSSYGLFSLDPSYVNLGNGTAYTPYSYQSAITRTFSLFAKADYIFDGKYILGGSFRRDGFSAFYPGYQYGNFPAVSAAWRISQENFLESTGKWLTDLKIRGSYGLSGSNFNISNANAYSTFTSNNGISFYPIDGGNSLSSGFYNNQLGNPRTTWETDKGFNIGLDATILNKLDLTLDYYDKKISGLLFQQSLLASAGGATPPYVNIGDVGNKGLDFSATWRAHPSSNFSYSIGLNLSAYKNTILNIPSPGYFQINQIHGSGDYIVRNEVGHATGSFFGYQVTGFYNEGQFTKDPVTGVYTPNAHVVAFSGAQPGAYTYMDVNKDGKIDADDRTWIGDPNPDLTYGVNFSATYKKWDLSTVLYGSYGNQDFNVNSYYTDFYNTFPATKSRDALYNSYGSPGVTNPRLPIQSDQNSMGTNAISSAYISSGSFLKLRNVQIGYTFSPAMLRKAGISNLHLYIQGANLITITRYKGIDPELVPAQGGAQASSSFGIDYGAYPTNERKFLVGVNLSF
jgi:TonB-linked SusC/RagA family outer membrane protein